MSDYREGQIIAFLDAHRLPEGTQLEWVDEGATVGDTVRIVSLPASTSDDDDTG